MPLRHLRTKWTLYVIYAYFRYHSTLCLQWRIKDESHPLNQLNETWKQMHYPPETATVMLLARMVALVNQANNKQDALRMFLQFCHRTTNDTHEIAHNLLGEKFVGQIDVLRQMMQKALNTEYTAQVCRKIYLDFLICRYTLTLSWMDPLVFVTTTILILTRTMIFSGSRPMVLGVY